MCQKIVYPIAVVSMFKNFSRYDNITTQKIKPRYNKDWFQRSTIPFSNSNNGLLFWRSSVFTIANPKWVKTVKGNKDDY